MKRLLSMLMVAVLALAAPQVVQAQIILDDFTTDFTGSPLTPSDGTVTQVISGVTRDGTMADLTGGGQPEATINVVPLTLNIKAGFGETAELTLEYSGFTPEVLTNPKISLEAAGDVGNPVNVTVFLNGLAFSQTKQAPGTGAFTQLDFQFAGDINISNVKFVITSTAAGNDAQVRLVDGELRIDQIPEPTSLAIFGLMATAGGGWFYRRQRRKAAA